MPRRPWLTGTVCAIRLVILAGCGGSTQSPDSAVRGKILYRGDPVAGGLIVFSPNAERGTDGPLATAMIRDDGTYQLTADGGKPVPAGWYRVAIAPRPGSVEAPTPERPYPGLPPKYRNPARSGIEYEVKASADNIFNFDFDDS